MLFLVLSCIELFSKENETPKGMTLPIVGEFSLNIKEVVIITFYGEDQEELQNKYIDWGKDNKELFQNTEISRKFYAPSIVPEGDVSKFYLEIPFPHEKEATSLLESLSSLLTFSACRLSRRNHVVVISCHGTTLVVNNFQAALNQILNSWVKKIHLP